MVPTGRFPLRAKIATPAFLGRYLEPFPVVTECQNCDQTGYCTGALRATRYAKVPGPTGRPDNFRCTNRQPGARRTGRTAKLWSFSDQTATGSDREEPSHRRNCSSRASKLGEFQTGEGNGSSGSAIRQTPRRPAPASPQASRGPTRSWQRQNSQRFGVFMKRALFFSGFLHRDSGSHRLQTLSIQSLCHSQRLLSLMNINHPCVLGTRRKTG